MNSIFFRALIGFLVLTMAVFGMALAALWAVDTYLTDSSWIGALVVFFALAIQISVYGSTLSDPVTDWIKEPQRRKDGEN